MRKGIVVAAIFTLVGCASGPSQGVEENESGQGTMKVALTTLLQNVEGREATDFAVGARVDESITVGHWEGQTLTYAGLLNILANNGIAALETDGTINLLIAPRVRTQPLPSYEETAGAPSTQWVWHIAETGDVDAPQLIPIVRPSVPQHAHLAAHSGTGKLIIIAPRGKVEDLLEMLEDLQQDA